MIWHNGSNTMWVSVLQLLAAKNAVIVLVTNDGQPRKADQAFDQLSEQIAALLPNP